MHHRKGVKKGNDIIRYPTPPPDYERRTGRDSGHGYRSSSSSRGYGSKNPLIRFSTNRWILWTLPGTLRAFLFLE
jgi:hypothetical protein